MLNIKNAEADHLARVLAKKMGLSITEVVVAALHEKLLREQGKRMPVEMRDALYAIGKRCALLPDRDTRSPDEILGYDDDGLPH